MSENENDNRETVADIVAEMLERADAMQTHGTTHGVRLAIRDFARRINAAYNRERAKVAADALTVGGIVEAARTAEKSSAVGNAAAMREALEDCLDFIMRLDRAFNPFMQNLLENAIAKANAALSAPARNCDVDDAKEQAYRFYRFCSKNDCEGGCPLAIEDNAISCAMSWAQMPYDEDAQNA